MSRLGLIGKGYWGSILKSKLGSLGNLQFVCSGRDPVEYVSSLSSLDWAFIATPTNTHYEIARRCLEKEVNVFCEKPLTASSKESSELHRIAQQQRVKLYVDDVFCFRNETDRLAQKFASQIPSSLYFIYRKYGSFKDTVFNAMTYHDMSILHRMFGHLNIERLNFSRNDPDYKEFEFTLGATRVRFLYDRLFDGKDKKIIFDNETIDYNKPSNDALSDMLLNVLLDKSNFERNKKMSLDVDTALEYLNRYEY